MTTTTEPKIAHCQAIVALMMQAFQSTETTRFDLNGFHIEPAKEGGVIVVATDGHKLLAVHDRHGYASAPVLVKVDPKLLKLKPFAPTCHNQLVVRTWGDASRADIVSVVPGDDPVALTERSSRVMLATQHMVEIDGTFPEWRRVVPKEVTRGAQAFVAFNVMKGLALDVDVDADGLFSVSRRKDRAFSFNASPSDAAMRVDYGDNELSRHVLALVMPYRTAPSKPPTFVEMVVGAIAKALSRPTASAAPPTSEAPAAETPVELPPTPVGARRGRRRTIAEAVAEHTAH